MLAMVSTLLAGPRHGACVRRLRALLVATLALAAVLPATAGPTVPPGIAEALARGEPPELIVEFDTRPVDRDVDVVRRQRGLRHGSAEVLKLRVKHYRRIKDGVRASLPSREQDTLADFSVMPFSLMRIRTPRALAALTSDRRVVGIYGNAIKFPVQSYPAVDNTSLALIGEPAAITAGLTGGGTTVLVIDTGTNYTVSDLGGCTAPATPASCRVSHALYIDPGNHVVADTVPAGSTANQHGTNVAAIIAGTSTATRVAVVNVFGTAGWTSDAKILAAINWGIVNQAGYNIRAINLSLADGIRHTTPCSTGNPYVAAFSSALASGIVPVVAAGNEGYLNGIAGPACAPGAVSVGAVYSANFGAIGWSKCSDASTAADKVTCFSNSSSFLSLLAPGALITAGGLTYGGTSQAAPFVAAALAQLQAAYPDETAAQLIARLAAGATPVTDQRNGIVVPRLNLATAAADFIADTAANVPSLPEWAAMLLGGLLLLGATRRPA